MDLGSSPAAVVLVKLVTFRHILEQKQPSKQVESAGDSTGWFAGHGINGKRGNREEIHSAA